MCKITIFSRKTATFAFVTKLDSNDTKTFSVEQEFPFSAIPVPSRSRESQPSSYSRSQILGISIFSFASHSRILGLFPFHSRTLGMELSNPFLDPSLAGSHSSFLHVTHNGIFFHLVNLANKNSPLFTITHHNNIHESTINVKTYISEQNCCFK